MKMKKNNVIVLSVCAFLLTIGITCSVAFGVSTNEIKQHTINNSIESASSKNIPDKKYVVSTFLGTKNSINFVKELKKLQTENDIGWYIIDLSSSGSTASEIMTKYNLSNEINYSVYQNEENKDDEISVSLPNKELLYNSYGFKSSDELNSEIDYITRYGVPTASNKTVTMSDNFVVSYTSVTSNVSLVDGQTIVDISLSMYSTSNSFPIKKSNFYIEDMMKSKSDDPTVYKVTDKDDDSLTVKKYDAEEDNNNVTTTSLRFRFEKDYKPESIKLFYEEPKEKESENETPTSIEDKKFIQIRIM